MYMRVTGDVSLPRTVLVRPVGVWAYENTIGWYVIGSLVAYEGAA